MKIGRGRKILEVVGSLAVGGAERVAIEVAAGLAARGFPVELLVAGPGVFDETPFEKSVANEAERRGVRVHKVLFPTFFDSAARRRMITFLREQDAALLHVHNRPQDWQIVSLCRLAGVRVIYTVHLPYETTMRQRFLYSLVARAVPTVVCVSRAVADHIRVTERVPPEKLQVIYNGIQMDVFDQPGTAAMLETRARLGVGAKDFLWVCAARLNEQKGHRYLIEAINLLPDDSRARFALAGEGPLREELLSQAARIRNPERVMFLGPRRDVPALLGAADGYVCSSLQEGHPLSLLEAMALKLPVVAPRLPSILEIEGDCGPVFFGPAHSGWAQVHDPQEIEDALYKVERDASDIRERAGDGRRHVAERFSLNAMIDAHEVLYDRILSRK